MKKGNRSSGSVKVVEMEFCEGKRGAVERRSVNLVRAKGEDGSPLRPGVEARMVDEGELTVVHVHHGDSGAEALAWESLGNGMSRLWMIDGEGNKRSAGAIKGKPEGCVSTASDRVIVESAEERVTLTCRDGVWSAAGGGLSAFPRIRARRHSTLTMSTGTLTLNTTAAQGGTLDEKSTALLTARLAESYSSMATMAGTAGVWIQPMAVGVKLKGASGETVYSSPAMVMSYEGWQCGGEIGATAIYGSGTSLTIPDLRQDAEGYVLDLIIPNSIGAGVESVEVWALPQHHIIDPSEKSPSRIVSRTDGVRFATALPGATNRFAGREDEWDSQMKVAAGEVYTSGECIGRYEMARYAGQTVAVRARAEGSNGTVETAQGIVEEAYRRRGNEEESAGAGDVLGKIEAGRGFLGTVICCGAGSIVRGGIVLTEGEGVHPEMLTASATASGDEEWTAAVTVGYADGSRSVRHYYGAGELPQTLSPLISWPEREATRWSIAIEGSDGRVMSATVALEADRAGGAFASYLERGCQEIELRESDELLPSETGVRREEVEGVLIVSDIEESERAVAAVRCGTGRILAIDQAMHSRSAWDVMNERFIVSTGSGIYALSYSRRTRRGGVTAIDGHCGGGGKLTAVTPMGVMVVESGGRLLRVRNSSAEEVADGLKEATAIEWHSGLGVLVALDRNGNMKVLEPDSAGRIVRRTDLLLPIAPKEIHGDGTGGLWLASDRGLHRIDDEARGEERMRVVAESEIEVTPGWRPEMMTARMAAGYFNGTLTLTADGGAGAEYGAVVTRLKIEGELNMPIRTRLVMPRRRFLRVKIEGETSRDFRLWGVEVMMG